MNVSEYKDLFITEAKEHIQTLNKMLLELEKNPENLKPLEETFRAAHTLKGMSATMGFDDLTELAHGLETVLDKLRSGEIKASSAVMDLLLGGVDALETSIDYISDGKKGVDLKLVIEKLKTMKTIEKNKKIPVIKPVEHVRVDIKRLDSLVKLSGELTINKLRLNQLKAKYKLDELDDVCRGIDRLTTDLQYEIMQARMVPIGQIFGMFPRMVRDLSMEENKKVNLVIKGSEIELDRTVLDQIGEPLVHLIRNAIDHGIELPEERKRIGKNPVGTIKLIARREKNYAIIETEDDGRGINPRYIRDAMVNKKIMTSKEVEELNDNEIMDVLYHPHLSTSKIVTEVSGRGVGLNVVKTVIESLGGSVRLESAVGKGSKFVLQLPTTLAIIRTLMVNMNRDVYAIPVANVESTVHPKTSDIKFIERQEMMLWHKKFIPLIRLHELFNVPGEKEEFVVVVKKGDGQIGLGVDSVLGQQETIIKPLDQRFKGIKGVSGATILGDGRVALILDIGTLID